MVGKLIVLAGKVVHQMFKSWQGLGLTLGHMSLEDKDLANYIYLVSIASTG